MKVLLIYYAMHTGGIETLILRMSDWLSKNGHEVDLLLVKGEGVLLNKLAQGINIIVLGKYPYITFINLYHKSKFKNDYDVIYSFSPSTTWMSLLIAGKCTNIPVVLNGVYHLYDYKQLADFYQRAIFDKKIPDACKVFMTPAVWKEHERILGRSIVNPIIWPLPISTASFDNIARKPCKFKIVSIGRLEGFKTYNIWMLDVIKELIMLNYNVEYYIYGDGIMQENVQKRINTLGLDKCVFLCGTIQYDKIPEVLSDAYAFVGMGTSVIESGLCKVPSIAAIAYSQDPITHGFVHNLKNYNCGEYDSSLQTFNVIDLLLDLFSLEEDEYTACCNVSYNTLKEQYEINTLMNELIDTIGGIKKDIVALPSISLPFLYIIYKMLRAMAGNFKRLILTLFRGCMKCKDQFFDTK